MNNTRREVIAGIIKGIAAIKSAMKTMDGVDGDGRHEIVKRLQTIGDNIDDTESEEQEAFDAMYEGWQSSEAGEKTQTALDSLAIAWSYVDSVVEELQALGAGDECDIFPLSEMLDDALHALSRALSCP